MSFEEAKEKVHPIARKTHSSLRETRGMVMIFIGTAAACRLSSCVLHDDTRERVLAHLLVGRT